MTQLTRNMYQHDEVGLFGLSRGQTRNPYVHQRLYWFNKAGEWLGYGDLSLHDFKAIAKGLDEHELFILVPEAAFTRSGREHGALGVDVVVNEALMVIAKDHVLMVNRPEQGQQAESLKARFSGTDLLTGYFPADWLSSLVTF